LAPLVPSVLTSGAALVAVGVKGWGGLETRQTMSRLLVSPFYFLQKMIFFICFRGKR
jgi:hypothetical protein